MNVFYIMFLCHPCLADIPTPRPIYSEIELGAPEIATIYSQSLFVASAHRYFKDCIYFRG